MRFKHNPKQYPKYSRKTSFLQNHSYEGGQVECIRKPAPNRQTFPNEGKATLNASKTRQDASMHPKCIQKPLIRLKLGICMHQLLLPIATSQRLNVGTCPPEAQKRQ